MFIHHQESQIALLNEQMISSYAGTMNLKNIMPLLSQVKGKDHVGFRFPLFQMNLEEYLEEHRDPLQLPLILDQVINGLSELHSLGYVHRTLDATHVMLNFAP